MDRTMVKVRHIILSLWCLSVLPATAQTVYSWQDSKGVVHYSQQPPASGEYQLITIRTNLATSVQSQQLTTAGQSNMQDPALCQQARDQLALLQSGQELFTKETNSEELRLLTAEERQQQILLANFEIRRRCP